MEFNEKYVGKMSEIKDMGMKRVSVGEKEFLLVRKGNEIFATDADCTHYEAPLEEGYFNGKRIVCPWHHAAFNPGTGDFEEPPAIDCLCHYETRIDGDDIYIMIPEKIKKHCRPKMTGYEPEADDRTFVIIGCGAAGYAAAQTLRQDGYKGRLVMITYEKDRPYDRPNLSKGYLKGTVEDDWMPLRSEKFLNKYGMEVLLEKRVNGVDFSGKKVKFSDGDTLKYDKLLIATGCKPRELNVPGFELDNVCTLRSYEDGRKILDASKKGNKVVVLGSSFIGIEVAANLNHRGSDVTVVSQSSLPFKKIFGDEIGKMIKNYHEGNGINFKLETKIDKMEGEGKVEKVVLSNGDVLDVDLVVVGIGVIPATGFLDKSMLEKDGGLKVDKHFKFSEDVYAAGDVARFPYWHTGEDIRVEHWRTAQQQGIVAGHNMAGNEAEFKNIPFFWSMQIDLVLNYVGHAKEWDEIIVDGDISKHDFVAYYMKNDKPHAAVGVGRYAEMDEIEEKMRLSMAVR